MEIKFRYVILAFILVFGLIVGLLITIGLNIDLKKQYSVYQDSLNVKEKEIFGLTSLRNTLYDSLEVYGIDLLKCKEDLSNLENIKTNDDLLKRDIAIYIDKRYTTVPRILAVNISETIIDVAKKENISPQLLVGLIEVESSFNPSAISSKQARGLMQVMPEWVKKFGLKHATDLHDVDTGIIYGVKVLKIHLKEEKGNITKGLYAYSGKNKAYASQVYESIGRFVAFRSTIVSGDEIEEQPNDEVESAPITNNKDEKNEQRTAMETNR